MAVFYIMTAAIAIFNLYEIKKENEKKEAMVYIVLLIILILYSILYYSSNSFLFDFYTVFSKLF